MILYEPKGRTNLRDFGIDVPLEDDRVLKCRQHLLNKFGERVFVHLPTGMLGQEDLMLVHERHFVRELLESDTRKWIIECYELLDEGGRWNRYDPARAKRPLEELLYPLLTQAYGSFNAMKVAVQRGFCFFLGGGMHHAMSFGPRGFCLVNDIVIGIKKGQSENLINHAWVIDTDAHKGDGTAQLTVDDSSISTLSIHMKSGWPFSVQDNGSEPWHVPSSIDIGIESGEEGEYLSKLKLGLDQLAASQTLPQLAVVVAGADPYEEDVLPSASRLKLSLAQMLERDLMVYRFLREKNIPQCWLMAGGYGPEVWKVYEQFLSHVLS